MKVRTVKYIIKEGFLNTYKNKLMSLASISTVTASLIILGLVLLITVNVNYNVEALEQQIEMSVFCIPELDDQGVSEIENAIKNNDKIYEYVKLTKKDAYNKAKEMLGKSRYILDGYDESFLPVTFIIKLKNPEDSDYVAKQLERLDGVDEVSYSRIFIDIISKIKRWTKIVSMILLIILFTISVFIISNTIKLTVFARRKEINIMKYIGATDGFIRWPFIVEGIVIGIIGAFIAYVLIYCGYDAFQSRFNSNIIKFIAISKVYLRLMLLFCLVGGGVGAIGSVLSIRKYLRV